jgi:hypothetical protein
VNIAKLPELGIPPRHGQILEACLRKYAVQLWRQSLGRRQAAGRLYCTRAAKYSASAKAHLQAQPIPTTMTHTQVAVPKSSSPEMMTGAHTITLPNRASMCAPICETAAKRG